MGLHCIIIVLLSLQQTISFHGWKAWFVRLFSCGTRYIIDLDPNKFQTLSKTIMHTMIRIPLFFFLNEKIYQLILITNFMYLIKSITLYKFYQMKMTIVYEHFDLKITIHLCYISRILITLINGMVLFVYRNQLIFNGINSIKYINILLPMFNVHKRNLMS